MELRGLDCENKRIIYKMSGRLLLCEKRDAGVRIAKQQGLSVRENQSKFYDGHKILWLVTDIQAKLKRKPVEV